MNKEDEIKNIVFELSPKLGRPKKHLKPFV